MTCASCTMPKGMRMPQLVHDAMGKKWQDIPWWLMVLVSCAALLIYVARSFGYL